MTPRDLIVTGVTTGLMIEGINYLRKEQRYLKFFRFTTKYPGITFAGFSALFGTGLIYAGTIKNIFEQTRTSLPTQQVTDQIREQE